MYSNDICLSRMLVEWGGSVVDGGGGSGGDGGGGLIHCIGYVLNGATNQTSCWQLSSN